MALRPVYEKQDEIPAPLREHYVEQDGKFVLQHDGDHPALAKVAEFRASNVGLIKENTTLKETVAANLVKLAELEKGNPRITTLEAELASEKAARVEMQQQADRARLRDGLRIKALASGARPEAVDMVVDKLQANFVLDGDALKAKAGLFSPDRPGEALTPEDSLLTLSRDFAFMWKPSSGSGSGGSGSGGGTGSGQRVLRDPTPAQLGAAASDIAKGLVRVEYSQ